MGVIIDPKDKKYFVANPVNFSPARNKAIINETIVESEKYQLQLQQVIDHDLGERLDVLSSYAIYKFKKTGSKDFKNWAGKDLHDKLIGEKILQKVRMADSVNKLQGNRKNTILM